MYTAQAMRLFVIPAVLVLQIILSACTLKGTTKAITDPTTDILSSTLRTWFTEDGIVREEYKVIAFTSLNYVNLKQDMARGEGEYLASLQALLGMPASRHSEFGSLIQNQYPSLMPSAQTTPTDMLASLADVMAAAP